MNKTFSVILISALLLVFGYLGYLIFKPFFVPIAWAIVFTILFYPLYVFILRYLRWPSVAAGIVLVVVFFVILGPISYLSFLLVQELRMTIASTDTGLIAGVTNVLQHPLIESVLQEITALFNITEEEFTRAVNENVMRLAQDALGGIGKGVTGVLSGVIDFVFMLIALFFFLKDGPSFAAGVLHYAPFSDAQKNALVTKLKDIVVATMFGGVAVAIAQGCAGGIAFALLGLSSPVLWGFAMAVTSFLPIVGPFVIWMPAALFLLLQGSIAKGIALIAIGAFGISLIDNFLRPAIVGTRTRMHYLALFFTVLGGIKVFGLIGIILGPLILAFFISMLEVFRKIGDDGDTGNTPSG